jgi:hypothetical protein
MKNNENTPHLNIPGITPETIYTTVEQVEQVYWTMPIPGATIVKTIKFEAMSKRFITNKYIKCLHDICHCWNESYYVLDALIIHDIIKQRADCSMEWTLNKTSLAWLFNNMKTNTYDSDYVFHIPGGFWNPIATLFGENKETLKKLISNKNGYSI